MRKFFLVLLFAFVLNIFVVNALNSSTVYLDVLNGNTTAGYKGLINLTQKTGVLTTEGCLNDYCFVSAPSYDTTGAFNITHNIAQYFSTTSQACLMYYSRRNSTTHTTGNPFSVRGDSSGNHYPYNDGDDFIYNSDFITVRQTINSASRFPSEANYVYWHDVVINLGGGTYTFYQNGTLLHTQGGVTFGISETTKTMMKYWIGAVDELVFFNRTCTVQEIQDYHNLLSNGNWEWYTTAGGVPPPSPTLTINTDLVNNTINYNYPTVNVSYNGTYANTDTDLFNCSLNVSGTIDQTSNNVNLSKQQNFTYNVGLLEQNTSFELSCIQGGVVNSTTGKYWYNVDTIVPFITVNIINNTAYTQNQILNLNVTSGDTNLIAYNYTFFDANGLVWNTENYFADNLTGGNYTNYTSRTLTDTGSFSIRLSAWDSHTLYIIPNYGWEKYTITINNKSYKGISFRNNYLNISTDDYSKIDDFALIKKRDRFLMGFNFTQTNFYFTLYLDSKKPIKYLPNSLYQGHFIINNKHWLDFQSDDITDLQIDYLTNYNVWRIKFYVVNNRVVFRSIGDLNYYEEIYYYSVVSETVAILTDINNTLALQYASSQNSEVNLMILGLMVFAVAMIVLGYVMRFYYLWGLSGAIFGIVSLQYLAHYTENNLNKGLAWLYISLCILFIALGIILQILAVQKEEEEKKGKEFYINY